MFVCMPVWLCVRAGVAVVSPGCRGPFVPPWVMWSCISVPVFVWPCSPCSPADRRPSSYLSCSLNCGPQCRDPATFFNNREINSAPPITLSASHPANEGAALGRGGGAFYLHLHQKLQLKKTHTCTHKHTHTHYSSHDINDSQWQQHTLCGGTHCKHTHFFHSESWSRHQLFSPRQQQRCWLPVAAVGMAMAAHKGDLRFEGCPGTRQSREGEGERGREEGRQRENSFKDTQQPRGHVRTWSVTAGRKVNVWCADKNQNKPPLTWQTLWHEQRQWNSLCHLINPSNPCKSWSGAARENSVFSCTVQNFINLFQ